MTDPHDWQAVDDEVFCRRCDVRAGSIAASIPCDDCRTPALESPTPLRAAHTTTGEP